MSFASHLDRQLAEARTPDIKKEQIISVIDLTLLDKKAASEDLETLQNKALQHGVAAICVYPEQLPQNWPKTAKPKRATVVNFPSGKEPIEQCLSEIDQAIEQGADEIDYVFAYTLYQNNQENEALSRCKAVIDYCKSHQLQTKIILESGAFTHLETLYQLSLDIIRLGCDFLKTSTGKIDKGASLSAAFAMMAAIRDSNKPCGIKLSGGIKTPEQASQYIHLAESMLHQTIDPSWFRIGASSLLDQLIAQSQPHQ